MITKRTTGIASRSKVLASLLALALAVASVVVIPTSASASHDPSRDPGRTIVAPEIVYGGVEPSGQLRTVRLQWKAAAHPTGIHGYNIYVNNSYKRWVKNTSTTLTLPLGAGIYVIAVHNDRTFSAKSGEWTVGSNILVPPSHFGPAPKPDAPSLDFVRSENGVAQLEVSAPDNTDRIAGYNLYVSAYYEKTFSPTRVKRCYRADRRYIAVTVFTTGSNPLHSPKSQVRRISDEFWHGPGTPVCLRYVS